MTERYDRNDNIDEFTRAYIACMLWSTNDESDPSGGEPLDNNYTIDDLSDLAFAQICSDCRCFVRAYGKDIGPKLMSQAGHDFWLTRNGHGAGFWDRPELYGEPLATNLTKASESHGEVWPYVGDDGKIYYE